MNVIVAMATNRSKAYVDGERDGRPFLVLRYGVLSRGDVAALRAILARANMD
jgi:hypothetical protein